MAAGQTHRLAWMTHLIWTTARRSAIAATWTLGGVKVKKTTHAGLRAHLYVNTTLGAMLTLTFSLPYGGSAVMTKFKTPAKRSAILDTATVGGGIIKSKQPVAMLLKREECATISS